MERKQTHTQEFKSLLEFYGRDKVMRLYMEEREKRKPKSDPRLNDSDADRGKSEGE